MALNFVDSLSLSEKTPGQGPGGTIVETKMTLLPIGIRGPVSPARNRSHRHPASRIRFR